MIANICGSKQRESENLCSFLKVPQRRNDDVVVNISTGVSVKNAFHVLRVQLRISV